MHVSEEQKTCNAISGTLNSARIINSTSITTEVENYCFSITFSYNTRIFLLVRHIRNVKYPQRLKSISSPTLKTVQCIFLKLPTI